MEKTERARSETTKSSTSHITSLFAGGRRGSRHENRALAENVAHR